MKSKIIRRIGALSLVILMIAAYGISMPKFALADACVMGECAQGFNCDPNSNQCVSNSTGTGTQPPGNGSTGTGTQPPGNGSTGSATQLVNPLSTGSTSICGFVNSLINVITELGAIVGVLFILWSGFLFIKAQGNKEELSKAKRTFMTTIIGLGILLGSSVFAQIIMATITSVLPNTIPGICSSTSGTTGTGTTGLNCVDQYGEPTRCSS
jgi:hypothetical protein